MVVMVVDVDSDDGSLDNEMLRVAMRNCNNICNYHILCIWPRL